MISSPAERCPDDRAARATRAATATRRPPRRRRRRAQRRSGGGRQGGLALLDLAQHVGGPLGVAVAQRRVVGVVDVAGGVLGVEVAQRPQQEAPLVLQLGEPVGVHRRPCRARRRRHRPRWPARRRRAASSSVGSAVGAARGASAGTSTASPATAQTSAATGSAHTSASNPVAAARAGPGRRSWTRSGDDLVVGQLALVDELADAVADVLRRRVARLEHALAVAHRAGDALLDRLGPLARRARPVGPGWRRRRGSRRRRTAASPPTPGQRLTSASVEPHQRPQQLQLVAPRKSAVTSQMIRAAHDAVGVDDPRLGHLGDAEGDGDRAVVVVHDRPVAALGRRRTARRSPGRRRRRSCRARRRRAERLLLLDELDQLGVLLLARHAAGREEVEHDPAALAPGELERRAVGQLADRLRRRLVRSAASRPSRRSARRTRRARRTARRARRRRRGRRTARPGARVGPPASDSTRRSSCSRLSQRGRPRSRASTAPTPGRSAAPAAAGERGEQRAEAITAPPIHSHRISGLTNTGSSPASVAGGAVARASGRRPRSGRCARSACRRRCPSEVRRVRRP